LPDVLALKGKLYEFIDCWWVFSAYQHVYYYSTSWRILFDYVRFCSKPAKKWI